MLYTVMEVSELVGISKQSMYKKIQKKELQEYVTKLQGITYINDIGYDLIKNGLKGNSDDLTDEESDNALDELAEEDTDKVSLNKEVFNALLEQLKEKDIQLQESNDRMQEFNERMHELNERLKQEQDLNKNNQVLQLRPQQDIKALEEHFTNLDTKLEEVKENMALRKQDKPKGFFNKIFNK